MRLTRLDLHAFGAFRDAAIVFVREGVAEAPGLTIVYGPNEAGKSTALRAVRQLFFGIDGDRDAFRVAKNDLSIGGVLRDEAGHEHAAVRRGSRKEWLYDAGNKRRLSEDDPFAVALKRFDEASYRMAYGLDHDELKSGAEAIAASEGNVDVALLAATTRVKNLLDFRKSLIARSEELFLSSANAKRTINELIRSLGKLEEEATQAKQPIESFHRLRSDLERVVEELGALHREKSAREARLALLQRYHDLFGDCVARERLTKTLDRLAHIPLVDGDLDARFDASKTNATQAKSQEQMAKAALSDTETELQRLGGPSPLSPHGKRIESLDARALLLENESREVEEAERNRRLVSRAADEIFATISEVATRIDLDSLALPKNFRETIRKLVDERFKLDVKDAEDRTRSDEMQAEIARLSLTMNQCDFDVQIDRLDDRLRAAVEAVEILTIERDRAAESAKSGSASLEAWIAERFDVRVALDRLPFLSVPSYETIEEEIERRKKLEARVEALRVTRRETEKRLVELNRRIDAAIAENLPSSEDLVVARRMRDQTLQRLTIDASKDGANASLSEERAGTMTDLLTNLANEIREADRIADILSSEADRCAKLRQDRIDATAATQALDSLDREIREVETTARRSDELWIALWHTTGARLASPIEMRAWRRDWELRVLEAGETAAAERRRESLDARIQGAFDGLVMEVGVSDAPGDAAPIRSSLAETIERGRQKKKRLQADRDRATADRQTFENVQRDLRTRSEAIEANQRRLADWNQRWELVAKKLPPASKSAPSETLTFLDQFADWRQYRDKERDIDDRVADYSRKLERFVADVDALAADLAEKESTDKFAQVRRWMAALTTAKQRDVEEAKLRERLRNEKERAAAAERRRHEAETALSEFCAELGVREPEELGPRLQAIREKRIALKDAASLDARLNQLLPHRSWEDLSRSLLEWSPETLDAEMNSVRGQIDRLSEDEKELFAELRELQRSKETWDGKPRAAEIEQMKQRLLAEISETAERYATYRIAASALQVAIDRYRDKNKSPILERASKFFAMLTLDRFSRLEPHDAPEGGIAVVGIRGSDEEQPHEVPVSGMSRGTCDQLYLAFRMALWEERLEKGSPLPIVLDDVLVHFDDERAAATLKAFDELAKRTQIVYFTHHRHLVELAKKTLPADRLLVRELQPPGVRS